MAFCARTWPDGGDGILADGGFDTTTLDCQAPFTDAHERNAPGERCNRLFCPGVGPAPVPRDELLPSGRLLNTAMHERVHLGNHFVRRPLCAARTFCALVMRPAIGEILGRSNGEEA